MSSPPPLAAAVDTITPVPIAPQPESLLLSLPDEIIDIVCGFLPSADLCRVELVCRLLRERVRNHVLWSEWCQDELLPPRPNGVDWKTFYCQTMTRGIFVDPDGVANTQDEPRRRSSSFSRLMKKFRSKKSKQPSPNLKTKRVATIEQAVKVAKSGQTIYIKPGRYLEESYNITKSVSLVGLGEKGQVVLTGEVKKPYTMVVSASDVQVHNISIERITPMSALANRIDLMMEQVAIGCHVKSGSLHLTDSSITCGLLDDQEDSSRRGVVDRGVQDCIIVAGGACLHLDRTVVRGGLHAVLIMPGACGHLEASQLIGHSAEALHVRAGGSVHACCCEFSGNLAGALLNGGGGELTFRRNKVKKNTVGVIAKSGEITIEKSEFSENSTIGVYLIRDATLHLRDNVIKKNRNGVVADGGKATIDSNSISNNKRCGIKIKQNADVSVIHNDIAYNKRGIRVHCGKATTLSNKIHHNTYGLDLCSSSSKITDNKFARNAKYGILVRGESADEVRGNSINESACGMCIRSVHQPDVSDNTMKGCRHDVLHVTPRSRNGSPAPEDDDDDEEVGLIGLNIAS